MRRLALAAPVVAMIAACSPGGGEKGDAALAPSERKALNDAASMIGDPRADKVPAVADPAPDAKGKGKAP